jgi:hypothetical protein
MEQVDAVQDYPRCSAGILSNRQIETGDHYYETLDPCPHNPAAGTAGCLRFGDRNIAARSPYG